MQQENERYLNNGRLSFKESLPVDKIVEVFNQTLNLPVDFSKNHRTSSLEDEIRLFREVQSGACSAKHYYLGRQLENLGLAPLYLTIPFYWQKQPFEYPSSLKQLSLQMPLQFHAALLVMLENRPIQLDATWDEPLSVAGFPNNKLTCLMTVSIGVVPAGEIITHSSAQERWQYILELKQQMSHSSLVTQFYGQLNEWLQEIRVQSGFLANRQ
ncbi:TPA: hypothetical protein ENS27_07420 [bacterium]|nr:hypothetical protein [bacterium]